MPIWIKALLAFALIMIGIVLTYLSFKFFPIPNETGFDGFGSLMYVFIALGVSVLVFILGLIIDRRHPYSLFAICLTLFLVLLILIRWLHLT